MNVRRLAPLALNFTSKRNSQTPTGGTSRRCRATAGRGIASIIIESNLRGDYIENRIRGRWTMSAFGQ